MNINMGTMFSTYLKTFSKQWWENLWYHYKWYIIGGIGVLFLLIFGITECATNVRPDFTMTYMGGLETMGQIEAYQLEDKLALVTGDIDNNKKTKAKVNVIYLDNGSGSEEMGANFNMADIEMAGGDAVVLLFDEKFLGRYSEYGFVDLSEYTNEFSVDESLLKRYDDGSVYAVNMSQNPIFTQIEGMNAENLYLAVRPLRANDKTSWQKKNHENGVQMARYIISGGSVNP